MLEKASQARMFNFFESCTDEELDRKISQVEALKRDFDPGSEASRDANFMLRHMRRIRAERMFNPKRH